MENFCEEELDRPTLEMVINLVHKYTGITMSPQKKTLLQGRLRKRMRELGLSTYKDYLFQINNDKNEIQSFINIVTTNETSFFRTARIWDYFQNEYLQKWYKENSGKTLNIWSAASSSGEEVYTIAICCSEFKLKNPDFNFKILGTDISTEVLDEAGHGKYKGRSIEAFKERHRFLFDKYLKEFSEDLYIVNEVLKKNVEFQIHNLFDLPKNKQKFDLVFLRNVLIYFETKDQEKALCNIYHSLVSNGELIVGESESLSRLKTPFQFQSPCIYRGSLDKAKLNKPV